MLKFGFQRLIEWFQRHPGESLLISLHDNEISPSRRPRILAHLKRCPLCQDRFAKIMHDWNQLEKLKSAASESSSLSEDGLVSKIQGSIHAWNETNQPPSFSQENQTLSRAEVEHPIAAVLGVYIGRRAANAMLHASGTTEFSNMENLAGAGSPLQILIGRKSAAAVESKIHRILSRLAESPGGSSAR